MTDDADCHVLQIIPYRTSSRNSGKREKNAKLNLRNATGDVSVVFLRVIYNINVRSNRKEMPTNMTKAKYSVLKSSIPMLQKVSLVIDISYSVKKASKLSSLQLA